MTDRSDWQCCMTISWVVWTLEKGERLAICDAGWASMEAQQLEEDNKYKGEGIRVWRTEEKFGEVIWERLCGWLECEWDFKLRIRIFLVFFFFL